ncbi:uncharacterized protein [Arachis hypogaea]|uniref:uncharacterized protein n=1 Tax=Arachis hypogaea TaxID=3818 RepID=UPI000DEC59A9|nr:uncharacterized protein LOC112795083 [Arachis hypogaea]
MGSLLPPEGGVAKFAQLYIYDTENEIRNRITAVSSNDHLNKLHADIVSTIKTTLDNHNVLAKSFRLARDALTANGNNSVCLRLIGKREKDGRRYNLPSVSEVAALIVGDFDGSTKERDIIVETKSRSLQRITELHPAYLGLQYPLLFPYGEDGWREDIILNKVKKKSTDEDKHVTMRDFFAFRIQDRPSHNGVLLHSHRLFQQFIVDAFSMVESARLKFIYTHQTEFRAEIYNGLRDAVFNGETNAASKGKRIILPATFTGGPRYMIQNYQDAMAICRCVGYPDLFITFTCNPQWDEIQRYCRMNKVKPEDRPDMICRLFKVKLDMMIKDLRYNKLFGATKAVIYTIEFQKRGLPHAHILLFLHEQDKYPTPADIDKIICAEIPDADVNTAYYEAVKSFMLHGPCGLSKPTSPCMEEGRCIHHFPKKFNNRTTVDEDGYPVYRRRDNGRTVEVSGIHLDNRYVVPHNKMLLLKYRAHINVEWCNQSRSIKYLFKYVNKGSDRVTACFSTKSLDGKASLEVDEVKMFYDSRYISPCEAAWRIFCYDIHYRNPSVERLSFHLPDQQPVVFTDNESLVEAVAKATVKESMFLGWFAANKTNAEARKLTYNEFPSKFVWKSSLRAWEPRKSHQVIGRMIFVPPSSGELYYLRLLLNIVKGPTTYADIRTYNGVIYSSFRDACYARGLLDDDKEYIDAIEEASHWGSGHYLRRLFAILLWSNSMVRPEVVWEKTAILLTDGILHDHRVMFGLHDLLFSEEELKDLTLIDIEQILNSNGKTLRDYPTMPFPSRDTDHLRTRNKMIFDELNYDRVLLEKQHNDCLSKLTAEQKGVYDKIMSSTDSQHGRVFFLYGHGGTGKTFLWITLASALRSRGQIVLTVASSGIASLLLPGGRTAHSRFAIPLTPDEFSTCNIKQGSPLAELIIIAKLIIWDEAPMMSKFCFEALDKTLKDLMRFKDDHNQHLPFGGKTIVFGGDFRQILPVIPKGTRQDIVNASLNSSYLWQHCEVLKLTVNMRLQSMTTDDEVEGLKQFAEWILQVGNGISDRSCDGCNSINIPPEFLITNYSDPIKAIVEAIYSDYIADMSNESNLKGRAILAPTVNAVDEVNDYMTAMNSNECKTYVSSNKCLSEGGSNQIQAMHTPEFLATIKCSGVPNHELKLKVGCPVMLIRNIDHSSGLCNGTRLIITRLGDKVIEAKLLNSNNCVNKVFIPRMTLTPSDARLPFRFQRRQFPLMVSYAMTINKSQGQSLNHVGLLLKRPVFTHGQLYVAISRVTNKKGLKIVIAHDENTNKTENVVYPEVFRNI